MGYDIDENLNDILDLLEDRLNQDNILNIQIFKFYEPITLFDFLAKSFYSKTNGITNRDVLTRIINWTLVDAKREIYNSNSEVENAIWNFLMSTLVVCKLTDVWMNDTNVELIKDAFNITFKPDGALQLGQYVFFDPRRPDSTIARNIIIQTYPNMTSSWKDCFITVSANGRVKQENISVLSKNILTLFDRIRG